MGYVALSLLLLHCKGLGMQPACKGLGMHPGYNLSQCCRMPYN